MLQLFLKQTSPKGECTSSFNVVPGIRQRNRQVSHPSGGSTLKLLPNSYYVLAAGRCLNTPALRICGVKDAADGQAMSVEALDLCLLQRFHCCSKFSMARHAVLHSQRTRGCSPALYPLELNKPAVSAEISAHAVVGILEDSSFLLLVDHT